MEKEHRSPSMVSFVARELGAYAVHGALAALRRVAHPPRDGGEDATVLFVHGHGGGGGAFAPLERSLRARGHRRFAAWGYRSRGSVEEIAARLALYARGHLRGPVDVVGHSLGGIIARVWLQELGGRERARALVTLSTPHGGLRPLPGARAIPLIRELAAGSPLLDRLARGAHLLDRLRCLAVMSSRDHFVRAGDGAFGAARVVEVDRAGHVGVLYSREVHELVADHLDSAES